MLNALRVAACVVTVLAASVDGVADQPRTRSAPSAACTGDAFREFDFWQGSWRIDQRILRADGSWLELPAKTRVSPSPDGCVLIEHWTGEVQFFWENMERAEHIWGLSVRRYDPAQQSWSIYWMDRRNPDFGTPYVGRFQGARGEFFRALDTPGGQRRMRIAFTRVDQKRVDWDLSSSADNGLTWTVLWQMQMSRED